jgi:DNA-binding transcriptional LysR family regulator
MPLSTVSRHLKALEEELDTRLITRTTRRLTLTESGRAYAATCRQVLDELDDAGRRLTGEHAEPRGELALTAPVVFGRLHVLPIVAAFLNAFPRVAARMLLVDRVVDLVEEGIDIGVRIGNLPDSTLRATRVGAIRLIACASPTYLAQHGTPASPSELAGHQCISFNTFTHAERWTFGERGKRELRVTVSPRLVVNSADAAIDAARAGLGIGSLNRQRGVAAHSGGVRARRDTRQPYPSRRSPAPGQGRELHRFRRTPASPSAQIGTERIKDRRRAPCLPKPGSKC